MSSKALSRLVRTAVVAVGVCGLFGCFYVLPGEGRYMARIYPELARFFWPWLLFLWVAALPCFGLLGLVWQVSSFIKREAVFTKEAAYFIKSGAVLLSYEAGFFLLGNIVFLVLGGSHPVVLLAALFIVVLALALAVGAGAVSRYIARAAALQEEADSTI